MPEKSGSNNPAISLPKGGGAIKGIGETFQPNLFTGTGNFSVPIYTSPGRNNFGPQLSLQYSTGNGNGPFGLGWQLSIPRITRKTEKGLPRYRDDEDVFVLSGAEDLVPVTDQAGVPIVDDKNGYYITRYHPRTEGLFARIERWQRKADMDVHWRITTKENITNLYGKNPQARIYGPQESNPIFEWLLEETFDAKGNHILYEYVKEKPDLHLTDIYEQNRTYTQIYPRRILYGNTPDNLDQAKKVGPKRTATHHRDPLLTKERYYLFEALFDYGDLPNTPAIPYDCSLNPENWPVREDPFSSFRSGFEIRTLRRCRRVLMLHHFKEGELTDAPLVKSTDFEYSNDPSTLISMLAEARVTGYRKKQKIDGTFEYFSADMPSVSFKYSGFHPEEQHYQSISPIGDDLPPRALSVPGFALFDLYGNGLPDILQTSEFGYYFWENLGEGCLSYPQVQHHAPAGVALTRPDITIGDLGGDGLADIIVKAPEMSGFYEATPDGGWKPFKKFTNRLSFELNDPNLRLIDLTGDGLSDALVTGDHHFLWFRCLGEEGYAAPEGIERIHDLNDFPDIYFNDPSGRVRLADMTGDGSNDIVLVHEGRIDYWPNLGYGHFGKRITMAGSPRFNYGFDPKRLFLADLDGSGCADLVYVDFDAVHFWFNRSGNSWSEKRTIPGTPYTTDATSVQFADLLGTGTTSLLWSYEYEQTPGKSLKILDFCGGEKPYLLVEMDNNMGATTKVQYTPSTKFYLEDKKAGKPWVTNLPFPVHILEKTEVIDHIGQTKLVTTYKYHHGYFDGREREFRGFGCVEQYDTEEFEIFTGQSLHSDAVFTNNNKSFHVPPVFTKTWFHTGVYFDENLISAAGEVFDTKDMMEAYRREYYQGDDKAIHLADHEVEATDTPHEAYRALRGSMIHSEIYALDGSEKESHPYKVVDSRYQVKQLQSKHENYHAVYLAAPKETITYDYERNSHDPRISQQLTLRIDDFGNVTDSVTLGYPRRRPLQPATDDQGNPILDNTGKPIPPYPEQRDVKAIYTFNRFINKPDLQDYYFIGIPCESKIFEIHGLSWLWPEPVVSFRHNDFAALMGCNVFEQYEDFPPANVTPPKKRLIDWKRSYFRKDSGADRFDFSGRLALGDIQSLALPYESYQVAFTDALLQKIYEGRLAGIDPASVGGYFQEDTYWWIPSGRQSLDPDKYYLLKQTRDPFGNITTINYDDYAILMKETRDALPFPQTNVIRAINNYRVLQPYEVIDPNQNRTQVAFDALGMVVGTAIMSVDESSNPSGDSLANFVADLNDNTIREHIMDPLNNPEIILQGATTRLIYDLKRYQRIGQPDLVYTLTRETHVSEEKGVPSRIQHSFVYSDGFGREAQAKIRAESVKVNGVTVANRWLGTGSKVYNNKGKPVQQFEPFFSDTHDYGIEKHGVSPTLFYDPVERVICIVHPNHTFEKVVFDPWWSQTWDVNDTALIDPRTDTDIQGYVPEYFRDYDTEYLADHGVLPQTWYQERISGGDIAEKDAATKTEKHAGTPTVAHFDTLGRPFLTIQDNGFQPTDKYKTLVKLDIEGNDLAITDPCKVVAFRHSFDIAGRKLRIDSVDAGSKFIFLAIDKQPVSTWDANGNIVKFEYDQLRRPVKTRINRPVPYNDEIISQVTVYGERLATTGVASDPAAFKNHRGKVYAQIDSSGVTYNTSYDFKGNLIESKRILAKAYDYTQAPDWETIDFTNDTAQIEQDLLPFLEDEVFYTVNKYDAMNRIIESVMPDHTSVRISNPKPVDGSIYKITYNEGNLLEKIEVDIRAERIIDHRNPRDYFMPFVKDVNYNEKGQRESIEYGNDVITEYTYDPYTYRLVTLITKRKDKSVMQNLTYTYDPVGNIIRIKDDVVKKSWYDQQQIEGLVIYDYDPLCRLIAATGREHKAMGAVHYRKSDAFKQSEYFPPPPPTTDTQALQMYTETYVYDPSGNITEIKHRRGTSPTGLVLWTRSQEYEKNSDRTSKNNRLVSSGATASDPTQQDPPYTYQHDSNGNITGMPHLSNIIWDYRNYIVQASLNLNGDKAYYCYDTAGQRTRKVVIKGGIREEWVYLGGFEIYRKYDSTGIQFERQMLHVMDDKQRIALVEIRTKDVCNIESGLEANRFRYQLGNHLGSSVVEVDEKLSANIISYEEFYPYGGTAYIGGDNDIEVKRKRYRYSGKERDEETGLYYYGARYYALWLGRWVSCDPAGFIDTFNLYIFVRNNALKFEDQKGGQAKTTESEDLSTSGTTKEKGEERNKCGEFDDSSLVYTYEQEFTYKDPKEKDDDATVRRLAKLGIELRLMQKGECCVVGGIRFKSFKLERNLGETGLKLEFTPLRGDVKVVYNRCENKVYIDNPQISGELKLTGNIVSQVESGAIASQSLTLVGGITLMKPQSKDNFIRGEFFLTIRGDLKVKIGKHSFVARYGRSCTFGHFELGNKQNFSIDISRCFKSTSADLSIDVTPDYGSPLPSDGNPLPPDITKNPLQELLRNFLP